MHSEDYSPYYKPERSQVIDRTRYYGPIDPGAIFPIGLLSGFFASWQVIKGLKYGKLAARLIDWDVASNWETPLSEVGYQLGIIPLID